MVSTVRIILSFVIILSFGISAFGQGEFLKKGESGLEAGIFHQSVNGREDGIGGFIGFSPGRLFDIGLTYLKISDNSSTSLGLVAHVFRISPGISPLGFSITAGLGMNTEGRQKGYYSYGGVLYSNLYLYRKAYFQTSIQISKTIPETSRSIVAYGGGLSLFFETSDTITSNIGLLYSGYKIYGASSNIITIAFSIIIKFKTS